MSQLIACKNDHGIVLAADSKMIGFQPDGAMVELKVEALVPLSRHAAILAGGTVEAADMCKALKTFIHDEGLDDIQDIYSAALPFLGGEYERFMRKKCEQLPLDPLHNIFFILAGHSAKDAENPFQLYLLWTKKKLPQLDGDQINLAYAVPRRMGLEYSLNQLCKENAPLEQVFRKAREGMEKLGEKVEEVGAPFSYVTISREGLQKVG